MALLVIENGCKYIDWGSIPMTFLYDYEDNEGSHQIVFTATQVPKIGDSIDTSTNTLIPLVGYIINNDPGVAQRQDEPEETWPSRIRSQ